MRARQASSCVTAYRRSFCRPAALTTSNWRARISFTQPVTTTISHSLSPARARNILLRAPPSQQDGKPRGVSPGLRYAPLYTERRAGVCLFALWPRRLAIRSSFSICETITSLGAHSGMPPRNGCGCLNPSSWHAKRCRHHYGSGANRFTGTENHVREHGFYAHNRLFAGGGARSDAENSAWTADRRRAS